MILRGHLEDLGVAEILHVVGAARRSGLLRIDAAGETADVLFDHGAVVGLRGAGMPQDPAELLGGAEEGGDATTLRLQRALESEIVRRLPALLRWSSGTFEFSLEADAGPFGALVLEAGIPVARLGARRGGGRTAPEPASDSTAARRATRLLLPEEAIALPGSGPADVGAARERADARAAVQVGDTRLRPTVLHALVSGPLRQGLLGSLADFGAQARAVTSLQDVRAGVEAARARGELVAAAFHAGHPDLPGLELLSKLRSVDATAPTLVLLDASWTTARQAALTDRALRLGARLLAVTDEASREDVGRDVALRLLGLAEGREDGAIHPLRGGAEDAGLLDAEAPPEAIRRDAAQLGTLARWMAAAGEAAEIARDMLSVASEHFERCVLLVRGARSLEPIAACVDGAPSGLRAGLPLDGTDFLSRAVRECLPLDGPAPTDEADAAVLRALGADVIPARVTVLPLLAGGGCFGALHAHDSRADEADVAVLSRFFMEASPSLWEALGRERRRAEARRARAGA